MSTTASVASMTHLSLPSVASVRATLEDTWSWLTSGPPRWRGVPHETSGTAAGHAHEVPASATRANRGAGHTPGAGKGQLPAYTPVTRKVTKGLSGHGVITGFSPRTSTPVAAKSTATSDYYQNADGSYTRRYAEGPINFRNAAGQWQPIDTTVVKGTGGRWQQKANSFSASFAPSAASSDVTSVGLSGGASAGLTLSGAAQVPPRVSGSTVTYPGVLPGTDLVAQPIASGVKQSLILHAATAPGTWVFPLDLKGLTPALASGGSVDLADAAGKTQAVIPPSYAYDSKIDPRSGERATTHAVSYQIVTQDGKPALAVTLDAAWLHDPARVFPVTVDPSLYSVNALTTFAETTQPGDNSMEQTIKVGSYNSGPASADSFMQFPDAGLQGSKVTVSAASVSLFDVWASTCTPERFDIAPVTKAWTPSSVTSYPGPSYGASIGNLTPNVPAACANTGGNLSTGNQVTVTLSTATFQAWANGTTANYGLAAYASTTDALHWKQFDSDNTNEWPFLNVTYTGDVLPHVTAQTPPNGTIVSTLTPRLTEFGGIDPGLSKKPQFDFKIDSTSGATVADSGLITATNAGSATPTGPAAWTVPPGLKWGQTYYWTVQAYDSTNKNYSPGAVWNSITVQVPQPPITSGLSQNTGGHGFDPAIGNYTNSDTDADVATAGPSLSVVRDYNSLDPRTAGAFGASWSSIFDARATEQDSASGAVASVVVTYPDGAEVGYGKNSDGSFTPPEGRFATLRAVSGGYTLTDKNDTVYTFKQSLGTGVYGITATTDSSGRSVSFTWASGAITTMTSAVSGRSLHLTWSTPSGAANQHVATVATDPATASDPSSALTWTYGYSGDQLTSVCAPGSSGKCTAYAYKAGSHHYQAALDEGPRSFWPLAETSGTTASSAVLANEGSDNGIYSNVTLGQPGPLAGGSATAAGFNGSSSSVQLPDLHEGAMGDQSISLWFKTTAAPGVLFSYSDQPIAATTATGNINPALYVGTDGKLNAALWYGNFASYIPTIVTPSAVNDGKWHHVVLTGSSATQVLWLDGKQVGTAAGSNSVGFTWGPFALTHDYLGAGFLGQYWPDEPNYNPNPAPLSYFNGSIADAAFCSRALTPADVGVLYQTGTSPASLMSSITQPSGDAYAGVTYDGVTSRVTQVTDENGGTWKLAAPSVSGSSQVYRGAVLGAGPADYYRLGDAAGATQAANEVNGGAAAYSNVTLGQAGPFGDEAAGSFNGTSSYMAMPSGLVTGAGNQSVSLWFKTTTTGGVLFSSSNDPIKNGTTPGGYDPELYVGTNGNLEAEFANGKAAPAASASPVNDGKWHNVVLAGGTASQVLYVDGKPQTTLSGTIAGPDLPNVYVGAGYIGGGWPNEPHSSTTSNTGTAAYFSGSIGEVSLYNSQLSADQVSAQYQAAQNSAGLAPLMTVKVTDPGSKTITSTYDPLNSYRPVSTTDALGDKTSYGYDTSGFLYTVTNPDGDVTTTGHDLRGNVVSTTSCQNQAAGRCSTVYETYYPDDTSAQLTTADPRNDQVLTIRDGRSASATDPTYETSYTSNSAGDVTNVTTPPVAGASSGRATAITYSDGTSTYPAADSGNVPAGLPVKIVSPGGATETVSYFHDGDVGQTTNADGLATKDSYDNLGRLLTSTEVSDSYPAGLATSYIYDGQDRVVTETSPPVTNRVTGAVHTAQTSTVYDPDGNVTSQTVADTTGGDASRTVSYGYNGHDQAITQTDADNVATSYTYDAYGNKATETDGNGNQTVSTYDANGNPLTETLASYTGDPANPSAPVNLLESSRAYDPAGHLASITDAMGSTTAYTYTDNGLMATTARINPAGTSKYVQESDTYDAAGNPVQKITNNGATVTSDAVDAADRTTATTVDPSGVDRTTTTTYTPDDQPATTTQTDASGATQVTSDTYDHMGNLTSESVHSTGAGNLTGWWRLNQTSGTSVPDSSGAGNTATATGVTWSNGAGQFAGAQGQGIATNGPVVNTAASFSVSAWVNMAGNTTSYQGMVSEHSAQQDGFRLQYDASTGKWAFDRSKTDSATTPGFAAAESSSAAATGAWAHLVGTYDVTTGTLTLYVNGAATGTATDTTPYAASGALVIGQDQYAGATGDPFDGQIANVQIYQQALSPAQVSALYAAGQSGGTTASSTGLTTSWTLDQRGLPTSMTNPDGNTTAYSYDEAGKLTVTSAPAVSTETDGGTPVVAHPVTTTGYNAFGEATETQDPNGNVTTTGYDGDGKAVSQTLPAYTPPGSSAPITATTTRAYDGEGNLVKQTDPLNNSTSYVYDQIGDLATVTTPDGGVTHYIYDTDGNQISATGPTGAQTQATYDYLGRPLTSTVLERYPSTQTLTTTDSYTASSSNPDGAWLSSVTSPAGVTTGYGYDSTGEKTSTTDGAGNTTGYQYDFLGRHTATVLPDGTKQTVGYDPNSDPVTLRNLDAAGNVLTTQSAFYDGNGNMLSSTDARNDTTSYTYGATNQLAQEVQPVDASSAITTSFGYDANGNKTRYTDGRGNSWISAYNSWNLPESQIEPATTAYTTAASSTFSTSYDADGRPVGYTDPGGVTLTGSYDSMGNLTGQSGSGADGATASRTFGYDLAGNLTSAATSNTAPGSTSNATGESFTYNDRGNVLTASGSAGSSSFGYNGDGLVSSRTDAAGTTSYNYDNADRLAGMTDPATGTSLSYGYNKDSQLTSVGYGSSGGTRSYGYNSLHQLTSDVLKSGAGSTIASISYGYDPNGNLTAKNTTGLAGAGNNTYTYDEANRLTSWNNGASTVSYGYDASGNRTQVGSATYTYDARDELTSDGTNSYSYTGRGTLAAETTPAGTQNSTSDAYGQMLTDGTESYSHDALGRTLSLTSSAAGGAQLALSYSGTSDLLSSDGTSTYSWTPDGTLTGIGVAGGSASQGVLALTDQHTDVVANFTASGTTLTGSTAYDPLGDVLSTTGTPAGRLGFQSALTDPATGKVNMGARWYSPGAGQFTSRDTVSNSAVPDSVAANPFAYAGDNPLTGVDPTGHNWWSSAWHATTRVVSRAWHAVTRAVSRGYHDVVSAARRAAQRARQAFDAEMAALDRATQELIQQIRDEEAEMRSAAARALHTVTHEVRRVYHAAVHVTATVWHETVHIAKAGDTFVHHHAAAIASIAAGAAVFVGCEAITAGVGTIGCAAAAGAVGNLVSYGMSCGSAAGGCSVTGALLSAGSGALAGAVGGALVGPLGGELSSSVLGDVLPDVAIRGLAGATAAAAAGAGGGASGYAGGCLQGASCSLSGLAKATVGGAEAGAVMGGVGGALDPGLTRAACGGESFSARTKVLTASGAAVAISKLSRGQKVVATSTKTGKTSAQTIAAVMVHHDTDVYDLKVRTGRRTAVIQTTSSHLFWDASLNYWVSAAKLKKGEHLKTSDGTIATADGGSTPKVRDGWMWDLTVPGNGDHDFFVTAGTTTVLVHNINGGGCGEQGTLFDPAPYRASPGSEDDTFLYQKLSSTGEHLKYGITKSPATRYTSAELNGGSLNILASGSSKDMLALERALHETLPIGPEERQTFYVGIQVAKGLRPPPY